MKIAIIQFDTRIDNNMINTMLKMNENYCKFHNYDYHF
jgi:hypothetical protein